MAPPTITGVHFIGSIPLSSSEEVFETLSSAFTSLNKLKYIPDGETGDRLDFIRWQGRSRIGKHPEVLLPAIRRIYKLEPAELELTIEEKTNIIKQIQAEGGVQTDYDTIAIESYQVFKRLRHGGKIQEGVKFLVCLPSPLTVITSYVRNDMQALYEEVYKTSLFRALQHIQDNIPKSDLAIQWDIPMEMCLLERMNHFPLGSENLAVSKYWKNNDIGLLDGLADRIAECIEQVREGVDVGLHICYGNFSNKHFIEPKDMGKMIDLLEAVSKRVEEGRLRWVHMPVPKWVTSKEYFEALQRVRWDEGGIELVLGLVHSGELERTKELIALAGEVVSSFSISTECGLGRATKEDLDGVIEICKELIK